MVNLGVRALHAAITGKTHPKGKIDVFMIAKKAFIKPAKFFKNMPVIKSACAAGSKCLAGHDVFNLFPKPGAPRDAKSMILIPKSVKAVRLSS